MDDILFRLDKTSLDYDYSNDCVRNGVTFYLKSKSIWERYFYYKDGLGVGDVDSTSLRLQDVYDKLWKNNLEQCKSGNRIMGDTLNSVSTTINRACKKEYNSWRKQYQLFLDKDRNDSDYEKECFKVDEEGIKVIKGFLRNRWHSLGNFIPCPIGCNSPRGFNNPTINDYWDLTLACIYNYYQDNGSDKIEKYSLKDIVKDKEDIYKEWLDGFQDNNCNPSWQVYVEKNFMDPFVEKTDGKYGKPRELWQGHFSGKSLPDDCQCIDYFNNASVGIEERSRIMLKALRKSSSTS